jgi:hypothetical protein
MRSPVDLLQTLVTRKYLSGKRAKDIKTSLQKLAAAAEVDLDDLDLAAIAPTYLDTLRAYFAERAPEASVYTRRNTVQNLKQFYRLLYAHDFLRRAAPPPRKRLPMLALRREYHRTSPYADRFRGHERYSLPVEQWPASVRNGWIQFRDDRGLDIRLETMERYEWLMKYYLGFCQRFDTSPVGEWDDIFEVPRVLRFITWHAKRLGVKRISHTGLGVFHVVGMLARYENRPEVEAIRVRERKLPIPEPMHNKQDPQHTFTADEMERIGLALLEKSETPLTQTGHRVTPYLSRAMNARDSLLLRLLWRVPMRNRQFREMILGKNLLKDASGQWILQYRGDELKVSERRGRINTYIVPFPPELVDALEQYLTRWHPLFPHVETSRLVFPTRRGQMYTKGTLRDQLGTIVYAYSGKRFYPHLARTLWVDQYLLATGDISTAAYMLNDSVQMMLKRYHELRGADHTAKAFAFNQAILGNGKGISR